MSDQKILSVEEILQADDVKYDTVEAWGGLVRIGSLSADEMMVFIETNEGPAKKTAGLRMLIQSLVDADGNRIGKESMLAAFRKKDSGTITKVVTAILKLNGLDEKEAKKVGND